MRGTMLITRVGEIACGFPIEHVVETMRPLPVEPIGRGEGDAQAPAPIEGVAMIRGAAVPVVDVRKLLGATGGRATRFVVVRAAARRIALAVDAVIDVAAIDPDVVAQLPPLLDGARRDGVSAIGARDDQLLVVLDAARVVPEDSWRALDRSAAR